MTSRLPPLSALRAFEAAGRHASFTRAAAELFVTPGAISRQIRGLEEFVGFTLFERTNREVKLTAAGEAYAKSITSAFAQIEEATRLLQASRKKSILRISAPLTFSMRWLMPRLASFSSQQPEHDFRLTTTVPIPAKLVMGEFDVAIRVLISSPDLIAHRLFDVELVPVCSPRLLKDGPPLQKPADLRKHTLLHSSVRSNDWADWLAAADAPMVDSEAGIRFESSSLAYQGAIEGIGVAIAIRFLVTDDLAAGRLVMPFDLGARDGSFFSVVYPRASESNPALITFRDWIIAEAGQPPLEP